MYFKVSTQVCIWVYVSYELYYYTYNTYKHILYICHKYVYIHIWGHVNPVWNFRGNSWNFPFFTHLERYRKYRTERSWFSYDLYALFRNSFAHNCVLSFYYPNELFCQLKPTYIQFHYWLLDFRIKT